MIIEDVMTHFGDPAIAGQEQWDVGLGPYSTAAYSFQVVTYSQLDTQQYDTKEFNLNTQSSTVQETLDDFSNKENREVAKVLGSASGIIDFGVGKQGPLNAAFKEIYYKTASNLSTENSNILLTSIGTQTVIGHTINGQLIFTVYLNKGGEVEFEQLQTIDHSTDPHMQNFLFLDMNITDAVGLAASKALSIEISETGPHIETMDLLTQGEPIGTRFGTQDISLESLPVGLIQLLASLNIADTGAIIGFVQSSVIGLEQSENSRIEFAVDKSNAPTELLSEGEPIFLTSNGSQAIIGHTESGETIFIIGLEEGGKVYFLQYHAITHPESIDHSNFFSLLFHVNIINEHGDISLTEIEVELLDSGLHIVSGDGEKEIYQGHLLDHNDDLIMTPIIQTSMNKKFRR